MFVILNGLENNNIFTLKSVLISTYACKDLIKLNQNNIIIIIKNSKFEPVHEIFNNMVCATSKASDQPAHMRSLIRAFASRLSIL